MNNKDLMDIIKKVKSFVKWEKKNSLNQKAIFLYKEGNKHIYLVENNGEPYYGFYTRKGFVNIDKVNFPLDKDKIKEPLLKNLNKRVTSLEERQQQVLGCVMQLLVC